MMILLLFMLMIVLGFLDQKIKEVRNFLKKKAKILLSGHTALGYLYTPVCIGPIPLCLPLSDQAWVIPKGEGNDTYKELFMISGKGFQTQELNTHSFLPPLHPCPQNNWIDTHSRIHWEECRGNLDRMLFTNSHGTVVD